jgi:hypothetical protein
MKIQRSIDHPGGCDWPMLPTSRRHSLFAALIIVAVLSATACHVRSGSLSSAYTDPNYQLDIAFGAHSHWVQPWRAYLETVPKWGIRPIILLNANQGAPCPARFFYRTVTADAAAGATTLQLNDTTGLMLGRSRPSTTTTRP